MIMYAETIIMQATDYSNNACHIDISAAIYSSETALI